MFLCSMVFVFVAWLTKNFWHPFFDDVVKRCFAKLLNNSIKGYNEVNHKYKLELFNLVAKEMEKHDGHILEIGCGGGANFKYYPKNISMKLTAVEPNNHFQRYLEKNISKYDNVSLFKYAICKAEYMTAIPSNSIGCVVSTVVLCSVDDQKKVLEEINRILKPGGKFFFIEHVIAKEGGWHKALQVVLNPLWLYCFGGCNLTRDTGGVIKSFGKFREVVINDFKAQFKGILIVSRPHIWGYAEK